MRRPAARRDHCGPRAQRRGVAEDELRQARRPVQALVGRLRRWGEPQGPAVEDPLAKLNADRISEPGRSRPAVSGPETAGSAALLLRSGRRDPGRRGAGPRWRRSAGRARRSVRPVRRPSHSQGPHRPTGRTASAPAPPRAARRRGSWTIPPPRDAAPRLRRPREATRRSTLASSGTPVDQRLREKRLGNRLCRLVLSRGLGVAAKGLERAAPQCAQ